MVFCADFAALRPSPADVRVVTSDGSAIRAHCSVLVSERGFPVPFRVSIDADRSPDADKVSRYSRVRKFDQGRGVPGAGADDRGHAPRVGRRLHRPRPRRAR
jgi:hypothetical protein